MSTRTEVTINGVRHLMTDEQLGNLEVDITPQQIEAIKLELSRERGEPEPALYDDESPALYEESEEEVILNEIIEIQERMSKGMRLINDATQKHQMVCSRLSASHASYSNRVPKEEYIALLKARSSWKARISSLWNHWFSLKEKCDSLLSTTNGSKVWAMYFSLAGESINPYFTNGDTTKVDELEDLYLSASQVADTMRDTHLLEEEKMTA